MQIHRLFEIVYILLDKKNITARELAERFEVSVRTILRDIDALSSVGIPVYTTQGKGGGIFIPETFILNKTAVTEKEKEEILFALQTLRAAEYPEIESTLSRMKSFFNKNEADWIEVDFSRWGNSGNDKVKFEILKNAIIRKEAVTIRYISAQGQVSEREVYPLKLIFKSRAWYLLGFCLSKKASRLFRVNRILELKLAGENFAGKKIQDMAVEPGETAPPEMVSLTLHFAPQAAYRLYDEFWPEHITQKKDGSFTVKVQMPDDTWLYSFLLSFGPALEGIKPESVKTALLEEIKKMEKMYKT